MNRQRPTALVKAMDYLAARGCSEQELEAKLLRADYSAEETAAAVDECRRRGYLNDELLAEDRTAALNDRGCGERKIRQKLRQQGLPPELIAAALERNREREPEAARAALDGKLRMLTRETDPRKKREKAFRFLASRGFSPDLIIATLESAGLD